MQVSYNVMMNVYAVAGLYREAEELFQGMRRDGCSPDSFTYLSLVQAYTVALKYSEAEEIINSMQKGGGIRASCAHFNLLLSAFAKAGLVGEAERVYRKIFEAGLSPDLACYRSMVRGYMEHGHVQQGISFFERISGGGGASVEQPEPEADRFIMSAAVHLYRSAGMEARADGVLNSMDSLGIPLLKNLEIGGGSKANTLAS